MRDVFVGALCAIALFLFFYKGYDRWDDLAGNMAGFCALGIALFPTVKEGPYDLSAWIHFFSASCFFLILAVYSLFLFTRREITPSGRKLKRNNIYQICGSVMIVCLGSILVFMIFFEAQHRQSEFVFWAETVALVAFGISWLTKGGSLYPDKNLQKQKL
jgi:ABC-type Fe3+-siderophore transport system permease subunit